MILSLGQGEPSYVPDGLIGQARDYADVTYLAFLQCYGRDLAQWSIICFFADHQNEWCLPEDLAMVLCRPIDDLPGRLAALAGQRLLEERILFTGPEYRLTHSLELRRLVLRLSAEWRCVATQPE